MLYALGGTCFPAGFLFIELPWAAGSPDLAPSCSSRQSQSWATLGAQTLSEQSGAYRDLIVHNSPARFFSGLFFFAAFSAQHLPMITLNYLTI